MRYVYSGNKTFRIQKKEYVKYYSSMPDNGSLMGYIRIKGKQPSPGEDETTLSINNKEYSVFDDNKGKLIGYLKTEDKDSYIGLTVKRTICPKWLIILTHGMIYSSPAAIVAGLCITGAAIGGGIMIHSIIQQDGIATITGGDTKKDPTTDDKAHKDDGDTESDATTEVYTVIDAIAYEGEYLKVGASDTIPLRNNIENEATGVNLQFIIKEGDKELYVSDEVKPGEVIDWNPSKYLSAGKHNIVVTANVYHQDTGLQDVGTDMNVALEVQ